MANRRKPANSMGGIIAALVLLVIVVAAVVIVVRSFTKGAASQTPQPQDTEYVVVTDAPTPSAEETASPTPVKTPNQTPVVVTPAPTATPAPTPAPTPVPDRTGSFSSDTGTKLNIRVDWASSAAGNGQVELTVRVYLVSYSIYVSEKWHGLTININGTDYTFDSQAISYDGAAQSVNLLGAKTVTTAAGGVAITASYAFRGSYSGVPIEDIVATGTAYTG